MDSMFLRQHVLLLCLACLASLCCSEPLIAADSGPIIVADTLSSAVEWNDCYHSPQSTFKRLTAYTISFHYKVLAAAPQSEFYVVINDLTQKHKTFDWTNWSGLAGNTGTVHTIFIDRDSDLYDLVIGIHNRAKIEIIDLKIRTDPDHKPLYIAYPNPTRTWQSPADSSYYVDSVFGSDMSDGLTQKHAWKTLYRVNHGAFLPGDRIFLKCGSQWNGYLSLHSHGTIRSPVVVGAYGHGPSPRIWGHGLWLSSVYLYNCTYTHIEDLDISNHGEQPQPKLIGVEVTESEAGTAHDIVLRRLFVHDVTGSELKSEGGGAGIDCTASGVRVPSNFDGLTIEDCHLNRTDRNGITMSGEWTRNNWFPSRNVVIQRNVLTDIGGDGIVVAACDGALVEHNVLRGGRMRAPDYAAGIWPWSCDNTTIQFNDVSGMKGIEDGEGFDSDWNCRNTLIQYNFSHDNQGGFVLICDDGTTYMPYNVGNSGTVVRYNVSVDDGHDTFYISGPVDHTQIYNNTIYLGSGAASRLVQSGIWGWKSPSSSRFIDNVFDTTHSTDFDMSGMDGVIFERNAYWGKFQSRPDDSEPILVNPMLVGAGGKTPGDYRPLPSSPLLHEGRPVLLDGARDFSGAAVPRDSSPSIGAFQK